MLRETKKTFWLVAALVASVALSSGCQGTGGGYGHDGHNHSHSSLSPTAPAYGAVRGSYASSQPGYNATQGSSRTPAVAARSQRTCPVTGEELGSMGDSIPVTVKGRTIYVCCPGCVDEVKANPDKYLAKVDAEIRGAR